MIKTETVTINGKEFIRTYSDEKRYVVRDGVAYSEAVDPAEFGRTYAEGDAMPETSTMTETEEKAMAYDIIMGVAE